MAILPPTIASPYGYGGFGALPYGAGLAAPYAGLGGYIVPHAVPPPVTHPVIPNPEVALGQKSAEDQLTSLQLQARAHEQEIAAAAVRARDDQLAHSNFVMTQNEQARTVSVSRAQQGLQSAAAAAQAAEAANHATHQSIAHSQAETARANQAAVDAFIQAQQAALQKSAGIEQRIQQENAAAMQRVFAMNQSAAQQFDAELHAKTAEGRAQTEVTLSVLRASQEANLRQSAATAEAIRTAPPVISMGHSAMPTVPRPDIVHPPAYGALAGALPFGASPYGALPYGASPFGASPYGAYGAVAPGFAW